MLDQIVNYIKIHDLSYIVLIVMLFILPRLMGKIAIPIGIGAFVMGALSSNVLNIFENDSVIPIFSLIGISSLFLFAGLEIDLDELKKNGKNLFYYLIIYILSLGLIVMILDAYFDLEMRTLALIGLTILTPSAGFILDSLPSTTTSPNQKTWTKLMAISSEIAALFLLIIIQARSIQQVFFSFSIIFLITILLPFLFNFVAKRVSIKAPGSDFSFLILLAIVTGTITKKLGAYYLVGAFLVGFMVNIYEKKIAKNFNPDFENGARFFSSFFMPFYFFYAGLKLNASDFNSSIFILGFILLILGIFIKTLGVAIHQRITEKTTLTSSVQIAFSLAPTLVFGLVMIEIIKKQSDIPSYLSGGLLIYVFISTILPALFFRKKIVQVKEEVYFKK